MPIQHGGELNHEQKMLISGKYELNKLTAREGSAPIQFTTAGGNESVFEIPTRPLNLARSVLRFTYTPGANAAGSYNRIAMDCLSMIRSIELRTRSGEYLCNLLHIGNYTKIVWKPETAFEKFKALDNHGAGSGSGAMLQKCNVHNETKFDPTDRTLTLITALADQGDDPPTAFTVIGDTTAVNQSANITNRIIQEMKSFRLKLNEFIEAPPITARRHDDTYTVAGAGVLSTVNVAYDEAKYFEGGTIAADGPVINVKLPLGMLFGTIFELDKTIGFNEILDMRIVWEATNRCVFFGTDLKSVSTGADQSASVSTIDKLNLFLAVETDPDVVRSVQSRIAGEGFRITTEYPHAYKTNVPDTDQNLVIKFNRAQGERIRRIYTSAFHADEKNHTAFDNDNRSDGVAAPNTASKKIKTYYTTLDGTRLQQFNIETLENEDYMILKDKLKGSAILNSDVYYYNWFHVDTWDNNRPLHDKDQNEVSGLSLDTERRWEFVGTTPGANLNHYTYMIAQRTFIVKGNDIIRS